MICEKLVLSGRNVNFLFNVIGTAVLSVILLAAMGPVENLILKISGNDIGRSVANAHTIFNVFQVVILMPFSNFLVRLTYVFVKGDDRKANRAQLKYIGEHYILTPATAVPQVAKEINRMGKMATENLNLAVEALLTGNEEKASRVFEVEKTMLQILHFPF